MKKLRHIPKPNEKPTAGALKANLADPENWTDAARAAFDAVPLDAPDFSPEQMAAIRGTTVGNLAQERHAKRGPVYVKYGRSVRYPQAHYAAYREMALVQTRW